MRRFLGLENILLCSLSSLYDSEAWVLTWKVMGMLGLRFVGVLGSLKWYRKLRSACIEVGLSSPYLYERQK